MGISIDAIGTALAQQHLRVGKISNEDSKEFLQGWMERYIERVKKPAA